jgi:hypothetical protein
MRLCLSSDFIFPSIKKYPQLLKSMRIKTLKPFRVINLFVCNLSFEKNYKVFCINLFSFISLIEATNIVWKIDNKDKTLSEAHKLYRLPSSPGILLCLTKPQNKHKMQRSQSQPFNHPDSTLWTSIEALPFSEWSWPTQEATTHHNLCSMQNGTV